MKKRIHLIILCQLVFSAIAIAAQPTPVQDTNPLQGTWEWVNIKNSCVETYIFGTENTAHITSGEEVSDAEYEISGKLTEKGFYKVTLKIAKDKGGKDCGESVEDNTGDIYNKFVMFHPSGDQYVSCDKETIDECVGPLKRVK